MFGVQVSHVLVCRKISFNCTLIAHENVTTEFFSLLLLFGVILFYFILNSLFSFFISSVRWFSLRLRTWVLVRMSRL